MTANGNGSGNTLIGVLKTLLTSPVGGWALAVILTGVMAYLTFKDRQSMYADVIHLRELAMPLIRETKEIVDNAQVITAENNQLLKEIRGMVRIPQDNRKTLKEIRDMLKGESDPVPTISNDQPQ